MSNAWAASSRTINTPQPGCWLVRLVKKGPLVPARIWQEGAEFKAEVIDESVPVMTIWHARGVPIPEDDFHFRVDEIRWFREHRPNHPLVHPRRAVNPLDLEWNK